VTPAFASDARYVPWCLSCRLDDRYQTSRSTSRKARTVLDHEIDPKVAIERQVARPAEAQATAWCRDGDRCGLTVAEPGALAG